MSADLTRLRATLTEHGSLDKSTVLALLSRLEQAERKAADNDRLADELLTDRDYWEAKLTNLVYSLATEEEVGEWSSMNDIADNLIEHIGGKMQKLEQAEQAVQRVREALSEVQTRGETIRAKGNNGSIYQQERAARGEGYLEATRLAFRALDGDGRG